MPIEAGPETDLAVARACGIELHPIACDRVKTVYRSDDAGLACAFRPSTDLNDAFLAAEKFGMFDKHDAMLGRSGIASISGWGVFWNDFASVAAEIAPALAICAAILKLSASASTGDPARPA